MTKPVAHGNIPANKGIQNGGKAALSVQVSSKVADIPERAFREIVQHLTPTPRRTTQRNTNTNHPNTKGNNQRQNQPINNKNNAQNHGNQGAQHASQQGLEHGRGHQKNDVRGQNQQNVPNNTEHTNTGNTPKTNDLPNQNNTPKTNNLPNQPNMPTTTTTTNFPQHQQTNQFPTVRVTLPANIEIRANLQNSLLRLVLGPVLQQNDIYLSTRSLNNLIDNHANNGQNNFGQTNALPKQVGDLLQNLGKTLSNFVNNPSNLDGKMIHQVTSELAHHFETQIQAAKNLLLNTPGLDGKHFEQLNIRERMQAAVDLLPRHIPAETLQTLQNHPADEILNGLLLARGFAAANENAPSAKNLAVLTNTLSKEISPAALRDIGQLVKILIADAAFAKTTANLDLAVQKFVRILLANNELGVLLAVINLAGESHLTGGLMSRSLALAQIYEMINRLILAGEKAMNEAMPKNSAENLLQKSEKNNFISLSVKVSDKDETNPNLHKTGNTGAEGALRQFLEFNPAFMQDKSASAFTNSDDARQAQKDFVSAYQTEIEQWLRSGNHRLVKDIEFEKPIGIVVERNSDGYFSASKARIVLVRDGSVQGWHFLKSFLVS